jgi:hypothetical protein
VRKVALVLVAWCLVGIGHAGPRVKGPLASVAPFSVGRTPADEELGYFGPELARAVAAALESAGIDVGPGGEWSVTGRIEAVDAERVRLVATTRGRTVSVEGAVEKLDSLAVELAAKMVPILVPPLNDDDGKRVGIKAGPPLATRPESAPAKELPKKEVAAAAPSPAPAAPPPPPVAAVTPPSPAPVEVPRPAEKVEKKSEMPDVLPAYPHGVQNPYPGQQPWGGYVTGRVVAHSIPDPPSAYVGTGVSATQAFYGFLGRRLRLAVVPTGVGLSSASVAQDEGWRAAARSVVMARIEHLDYVPQPAGVAVRLRLQVVVVREGRLVLRRVVDSPMSDPMRRTDPVYQAVSAALESLLHDLASVLGG